MDIKKCTQRNLSVLVTVGVVALVHIIKKEKGNDQHHWTQGKHVISCHARIVLVYTTAVCIRDYHTAQIFDKQRLRKI